MKAQLFRTWNASNSLASGRAIFEGITYGDGMRVYLREAEGAGQHFYLNFPELPTAVRIANESMRLASLRLVPKDIKSSIFQVENSEFLAWLNKDSLHIYEHDPLFHLAIVTEEWIDIVCNENPTFVLISQ